MVPLLRMSSPMPTPPDSEEPSRDSESGTPPRALVIMGVAGSGKTTVARLAAEQLGWVFVEADELHPVASREKMSAGIGLSDSERLPWLAAVRGRMEEVIRAGRSVVVACSALKEAHRQVLADIAYPVRFVWLDVPEAELRRRLLERRGHFAGADLLASQLAALEPPRTDDAVHIPASRPLLEVVAKVVAVGR